MRRISDAGKIREKRGTGTGANYKPWIQTGEFGSLGTTSNPIDWKTGRQVQLLSQAETIAWYLLRWDDDNLDVREQFPLDFEETQALAEQFSIKHPTDKNGNKKVMTTDFLVTRRDQEMAIAVKNDSEGLKDNKRVLEKLYIEKMYWKKRNISFRIYTKDTMNRAMADNIRNVMAYYRADYFPDKISLLKYLIAHKILTVDMSEPLNFRELLEKHKEDVEKWMK